MGRAAYIAPEHRIPGTGCATRPFAVTCHTRNAGLVFRVEMANHTDTHIGGGWRLLLLVAGFGIASLGWTLIMTALFAFIGLPVFIFGLALMQAQER
jgi:hypothetical protein